jgi:hypothetical protein
MKLSLTANLVLNSVCPVLSFPERFQPITAAAVCAVARYVLETGAFNARSQYFIPLFNRIRRGDEASNWGGATQAQQGMTFRITLIFPFNFVPMVTGPFSKCENRSGSQIECQVRTWAVLSKRFSLPVLTRTGLKTAIGFQPTSENHPPLVQTSLVHVSVNSCIYGL